MDGCLATVTDGGYALSSFDVTGCTFRNCIAYDCYRVGFSFTMSAGQTTTVQNCTAVNCGRDGFEQANAGTTNGTNLLAYSNGDQATYWDYKQNGGTLALSYCASSDATADDFGGTGHKTSISDPFVSIAGDDYQLTAAGVTALTPGSNLSGSFTTDVDGDTRSNWAMGADDGPAPSADVLSVSLAEPLLGSASF